VLNFEFENSTKIVFGKDVQHQVGKEVSRYSRKVLLHYGGGSIKQSGLFDQVVASLKDNHIGYIELGGVKPNPRLSLVREGISLCKENNIDFILAVGGGSVIDSAKAIALGASNDADVWDFYLGKKEPERALAVGVVLTIAAAGSESSNGSVITNEENSYKRDYAGPMLFPKFALLNPELTFTLPNYQTSCGVADILAHIMERYFTQTDHTDVSDRLCEATMKSVIEHGLKVQKYPKDYDVRAEIMWGGTIAHNNLLGRGREEDWASHKIEHELSGMYDIAHGAGLAIVFPAWMEYVYKENLSRFVQYAVRVWDVDMTFLDQESIACEGIKRTKEFFSKIDLPVSLAEAGIDTEHFKTMSERAVENGVVGSFKKLGQKDVEQILTIAK
jgi:hypothetical protein